MPGPGIEPGTRWCKAREDTLRQPASPPMWNKYYAVRGKFINQAGRKYFPIKMSILLVLDFSNVNAVTFNMYNVDMQLQKI